MKEQVPIRRAFRGLLAWQMKTCRANRFEESKKKRTRVDGVEGMMKKEECREREHCPK